MSRSHFLQNCWIKTHLFVRAIMLGSALNEFRVPIRQLVRNPGFNVLTILTLALGIGTSTAIFSLIHAVLLKPLPYPNPEELQLVNTLHFPHGRHNLPETAGESLPTSYGDFYDWRSRNLSFQSIAAFDTSVRLFDAETGAAARVRNFTEATAGLFETLEVQPALGRTFTRQEEQPGYRSIILSHQLWVSDFGSSQDVVGRKVKVSDRIATVIGVMPAGFRFPLDEPADFWTTTSMDLEEEISKGHDLRTSGSLMVVGRLRPGVSAGQARADVSAIQRSIAQSYPVHADEYAVSVLPELEQFVSDLERPFKLLTAAVACLLLIACSNASGLLLVRASGRSGELGLRAAFGANGWQLVRPLLVEGLLLGLTGGIVGILFAWTILRVALRFVPQNLPRLGETTIDLPVLTFSVCLSLIVSVAAGLLPAWRSSRIAPTQSMSEHTANATIGQGQHRLQNLLVVAEVALGFVLVVCSGLLLRSFEKAMHVDPGFHAQGLLQSGIALTDQRYSQEQTEAFLKVLLARLRAIPGVDKASAALPLPLTGSHRGATFKIDGQFYAPDNPPYEYMTIVEPDYFETIEEPLIRGRLFTAQDHLAKSALVAIVNQTFADKYFPQRDPIGQHIAPDILDEPARKREIIGVVGNTKRGGLRSQDAPEFFLPYAQALIHRPTLIMRVRGNPYAYARLLAATAAALDPDSPIFETRTMVDQEASSIEQQRFEAILVTAFASISLFLTSVGLYSLLAYSVAQRRREMGLRIALGASRRHVLLLILRRGLLLSSVGLGIGLGLSLLITRWMAELLFKVTPLDLATYSVAVLTLLAVVLLASVPPAIIASQSDPLTSLREG